MARRSERLRVHDTVRGSPVPTVVAASIAGVVGAVVSHYWDPDRGHARRIRARDHCAGSVRRALRRMRRAGARRMHYAEGRLHGALHHAVDGTRRTTTSDATLVQKVRSEVLGSTTFRGHGITVDAYDGTVHLRGELPDEALIEALVHAVEAIRGVARVDSCLHMPGMTAPNKNAAIQANLFAKHRSIVEAAAPTTAME